MCAGAGSWAATTCCQGAQPRQPSSPSSRWMLPSATSSQGLWPATRRPPCSDTLPLWCLLALCPTTPFLIQVLPPNLSPPLLLLLLLILILFCLLAVCPATPSQTQYASPRCVVRHCCRLPDNLHQLAELCAPQHLPGCTLSMHTYQVVSSMISGRTLPEQSSRRSCPSA